MPDERTPRKMTLRLASPEQIIDRSYGEVVSSGTLDRQTYTPERGGLFCEVIFGPVKSFECQCGRISGISNINSICGKCKVEIIRRDARQKRMGHVQLGAPVVHPWYFKQRTNKIGRLLGIKLNALRDVIYYRRRIVVQLGSARPLGVEAGQLLTEDDYHRVLDLIRADDGDLSGNSSEKFIAETGGEAVLTVLQRLDLDRRSRELRYQVRTETSQARRDTALKRLRVVERFREAARRNAHEPEWMVLRALPVTPPDLRPLLPLDKGGFATSDLNELYERVIIRNNRLKGLIDVEAPERILHDAKRLVQQAVDDLLDKGTGSGRDAKKSLSDQIKGKEGRFRQDLLGKRVDFSGRSVIVAGPELKLHQCGLPKAMAYELYKPFLLGRFEAFIVAKLVKQGVFEGESDPFYKARRMVRNARKMATMRSARGQWSREAALVDDILRSASEDEKFLEEVEIPADLDQALEEVMQGRPVLLNRQPTLHRLGIQAFQPVLTDEKAIRLHPLVCTAYNADFDGDQVAVHVPLSEKARREVRRLMRPVFNILSPAHGEPLAAPTQDMILGLYYMTKPCEGRKGAGKRFASTQEVRIAYDHDAVDLRARVELRDPNAPAGAPAERIDTTVGRVLFNEVVPEGVEFVNEVLDKTNVRSLIGRVLDRSGYRKTARFLDDVKALGFEHATKAGLTFSLSDLIVPDEKTELVEEATRKVAKVNANYDKNGRVPAEDRERYDRVVSLWTEANSDVSNALYHTLEAHKDGFNAIYMMVDSGARGSQEQIRQLGGMRGLMSRPRKETPAAQEVSSTSARSGQSSDGKPLSFQQVIKVKLKLSSDDRRVLSRDSRVLLQHNPQATSDSEELAPSPDENGNIRQGASRDVIEDPIRSNFKEGLSVLEYFISTHGARKGLADTAIKTADAGYLTRRLVAVAQDVTVVEEDCGTDEGVSVRALRGPDRKVLGPKSLDARVAGRMAACDVKDPQSEALLVAAGEWIGDATAEALARASVKAVEIRSVLTCEARSGVCACCYGRDLTTQEQVEIGEKVGAVAAQSIGEPGTQLTLRTFHTGGTAGEDITGGLPRVEELFEARPPDASVSLIISDGTVSSVSLRGEAITVISEDSGFPWVYEVDASKYNILVREGDSVSAGDRFNDGPVALQALLDAKGMSTVRDHLVDEVQKVYASQGIDIDDKHVEIIVRKMTEHVEITDPGDTDLLEGEQVNRHRLMEVNVEIEDKRVVADPGGAEVEVGRMVSLRELRDPDGETENTDLTEAEVREARPAVGEPVLLGITKAALAAESWVAAAGFQETPRVITEAAVRAQEDPLHGMMGRVISGRSTKQQPPTPLAVRAAFFQVPFKAPAVTKAMLEGAEVDVR